MTTITTSASTSRRTSPATAERACSTTGPRASDGDGDESIPLYLRQFRHRQAEQAPASGGRRPERAAVEARQPAVQRALTEDSRNKEIVPPEGAVPGLVNDVFLIRHGETQGYLDRLGADAAGRVAGPHLRPHDGEADPLG